jgi:5'-methylthioadenosine phosphorylase
MSTDYDCWKTDEPPVNWEEIVTIFKKNAEKVTSVLVEVIKQM